MGKIYSALKKAQQEAQQAKDKETTPRKISRDETPGVIVSPVQEVKNSLVDEKEVPHREEDYQLSPGKGSDRYSFEKMHEELFAYHQPHSLLSEELRKLCIRLNLSKNNKVRSIMVTSALADEGKTTVAANLAISLTQGFDQRVLLVDGDLRKPSIHDLFGLKPNDGLVSFLMNGKNISDSVQQTDIPNLLVLPSRIAPDHPAKLMGSERMQHLIEEITGRNRDIFIVFDSTPVQQTSEPAILAKEVDAILLVVRAGMTNRDLVKNTLDTLGREKVLGIIFNHSNEVMRRRYRYYYQPETKKE